MYCSSCGLPIPDGQGSSCSMCYGDVAYGKDHYYEKWIEEQIELERQINEENEGNENGPQEPGTVQ